MNRPAEDLTQRPRRNRRSPMLRRAIRETALRPSDLLWPAFVVDGDNRSEPIPSMPGCLRNSVDRLVEKAKEARDVGLPGVALFPALPESSKDATGQAGRDPDGLLPRATAAIKAQVPGLLVITDVALDPYSSDGHDGLVRDGEILNDETLPLLAEMACVQADAGADLVAPSDMMDGRVGAIRRALDAAGHTDVGILSYAVKYASALYGPFRDALDSAPRHGDKKTYQMDPANVREAVREVRLDEAQGADVVMVKPGLPYLDVIARVRAETTLPVAAYQVSGEYAMIQAAGANGWLDVQATMHECLLSLRRAGADLILTYAAIDVARTL